MFIEKRLNFLAIQVIVRETHRCKFLVFNKTIVKILRRKLKKFLLAADNVL